MKKKLTAAAVIAVLFVVLLLVYRLVVVPMMNAADEPEETTAVSLVPGEVEGVRGRIQMFDQVTSDKVQSLYVHNGYGTYELVRKDSSLVLKGHENLLLNAEKLAQAVVNAGYTLSTYNAKVTEEDFAKYGLAPGESDNYYVLTSTAGKRYTVYIGDRTLAGDGYYARYEGRDAMYVLDDSIEGDLLAPATALVRPLLAYPSKLNSYYLMQTFLLAHGEETFLSATYLDPDRRNELAAMSVQLITYPGEYPAGEYYDDVLSLFCDFEGSEVVGIDFSDAALESFGLKTPAYTLYAVNTAVDDDGNPQSLVENFITFSEKQRDADGSEFYYAASYTFGVIARVEQITLDFLEWSLEKWVSPYVFQVNIQNVAEISFAAEELDETFTLGGKDNDSLTVTARTAGKIEDVKNFRQLWKVLLSVTEEGTATFDEAERDTIVSEDNLLLTLSVRTKAGNERVYKFYPYSDRRVYYTVNGSGEFYVNRTMLDKVIADVRRVQAGETVNPDTKY